MESDRKIGKIVSVNTYNATIELDKDAQSFVKNSYSGTHKIGIINSYVVIPLGADKILGIVTKVNMFEDSELNYKNSSNIILPKSKRTMSVTMIGSIVMKLIEKDKPKEPKFEYGVVGYPALDNPVWSITEEELSVIFRTKTKNTKQYINIGKSTVFPDYNVTLDMDNFFGKHAAILGNTGSGKSCTVTAIIRSVLEDKPEMKNAHFIIFDTNNEYENAFTKYEDEKKEKIRETLFNRHVIRDDGLQIPHWFMNGEDYEALFTPAGQIQAPVLSQALIRARGNANSVFQSLLLFQTIGRAIGRIRERIASTNGYVINDIRAQAQLINNPLVVSQVTLVKSFWNEFDFTKYKVNFKKIYEEILPNNSTNWAHITHQDIALSEVINKIDSDLMEDLNIISEMLEISTSSNMISIDTPSSFSFREFREIHLPREIQEQERTTPRVRGDMSSLILRIDRMFRDPRYNFFFNIKPFEKALATFLRFIFGEFPDKNFEENEVPWQKFYNEQKALFENPDQPLKHSITIIDFSNISSDVLENMTALVGRLIFEFMQRIRNRGSYPIVLVLEEAHHYIPELAQTERQVRARKVFERIAKEGRKFGLSLLIASQRPSELSKTIMAQCNSFIVHRIQNPEDQQYFRSVISSVSHELLNQLPALPQRTALVLGDCVTAPIQVTIRDVSPTPDSRDPRFSEIWSDPEFSPPNFEDICKKWEEGE